MSGLLMPVGGRPLGREALGLSRENFGHLLVYSAGNYSFTVPKEGMGLWRFAAWGGGETPGNSSGAGGALAIKDVYLSDGQAVGVSVGGAGAQTVLTFAQGIVVAGAGSGGVGGAATGGDINVSGSAPVGQNGGAAGSYGEFRGGAGGAGIGRAGRSPGGGPGAFTGTGLQEMAASGLVIAYRIRSL